ncbi:conserved protein of unknown function [Magnetospirillum gryphiswaldense MSR-1 v2]|uniref:Uncharacterized protein n=1 Tax=Magnetospirillum gryphiswaldense (strain DSM 6361 / JCM 21280 / NBRC 15271 / MSR-1) TaxID=431944 RepID=V6F7H5_MAGGM|nr:hypothetical protein [Magnetospirillum gryphiswaldense]CDL01419.1 conserved protein of unknown function [Magnetospirillum gryphiswaldense MSR-1 v2]
MTPVARLEAALAATVDSSAPPPLAGGDIADVIGSVLHAFAHWLQSQLPASATPLYGIMREGRLLARLHRRHGGTAAEIWLNRRLCMKAAILSAEDDEALRNFLVRGRRLPLSPAQAACELGLPPPLSSPGLALTAGSDSLESFLAWLRHPAQATPLARTMRELRWRLVAHLDRVGALSAPHLFLTDLGYAANIQNALEKILRHEGRTIRTIGLYLLTTPGARWVGVRGGETRAFLAELGEPAWFTRLFSRSPEPLEALCASETGPLLDWNPDGTPHCAPSLLPPEQCAEMRAVQEAIINAPPRHLTLPAPEFA